MSAGKKKHVHYFECCKIEDSTYITCLHEDNCGKRCRVHDHSRFGPCPVFIRPMWLDEDAVFDLNDFDSCIHEEFSLCQDEFKTEWTCECCGVRRLPHNFDEKNICKRCMKDLSEVCKHPRISECECKDCGADTPHDFENGMRYYCKNCDEHSVCDVCKKRKWETSCDFCSNNICSECTHDWDTKFIECRKCFETRSRW